MNSFHKNNLNHIKNRFTEQTGVELPAPKSGFPLMKTTAIFASVLFLCLTAAFAPRLFSGLDDDNLSLRAVYEGNGIVTVLIENQSDKELCLQPEFKLMKWSTGEEVEALSHNITITNTKIPAHSTQIMTIDLSDAYDITQLEQPLSHDDWYYFVFTNNYFAFGQDWMCAVAFAETEEKAEIFAESIPSIEPDPVILQDVTESLRFYFETISLDSKVWRSLNAEYVQAYTKLFSDFQGTIVPSVSPVLPGNKISGEKPYLMVNAPSDLIGLHWSSCDVNRKLLATETEHALVISAGLPLSSDSQALLPLFYIFTYEKATISRPDTYAFLYGRILPFADLTPYQVYEDEQYVCYEVSGLIYSDLEEYTQSFAGQNKDIRLDEQTFRQVKDIYTYYKENLGSLFYYKDHTADGPQS